MDKFIDKQYCIRDNVLIKYIGESEEAYVPEGVVSIGSLAFADTEVRTVIMPFSLRSVESFAFYNARNISKVHFQEGITKIGDSSFRDCESLETVNFPVSLLLLGDSCFQNTGIVKVVINSSISTLPQFAFANCNKLENVVLGKEVIGIGKGAFCNCKALKSTTFSNRFEYIGNYSFVGCNRLDSIDAPVKKIRISKTSYNIGMIADESIVSPSNGIFAKYLFDIYRQCVLDEVEYNYLDI